MANQVMLDHFNRINNYYGYPQQHQEEGAHAAPAARGPNLNGFTVAPVVTLGGGGVGTGGGLNAFVTGSFADARAARAEDNADARATSAAIAGGIALIAGAGAFAYFLRNWSNNRTELKEFTRVKQEMLPAMAPGPLNVQMQQVVNTHIDILENKCAKSRNIALLTAGMLLSAGAGFAGGMLAIQWLITAAIVSAVVLAAITVFMVVWNWTDPANTALPQSTKETLDHILATLAQDQRQAV